VGIILQTIYLQRIILIWMLFRNVTFTYALLALITYHVYVVCWILPARFRYVCMLDVVTEGWGCTEGVRYAAPTIQARRAVIACSVTYINTHTYRPTSRVRMCAEAPNPCVSTGTLHM